MKIYISNYRDHWLSPYVILEKVFFWREIDYDEPKIELWATRLEPLCTALQTVRKFIHPRIEYVKIDKWDTWNMDSTLSTIVLPMLKQLKETKHGAPFVDDADVPKELKSTSAPPKENEWDTDENHFKRWDWVLDEMIFAFDSKLNNWEEQFYSGEHDIQWKKLENDCSEMIKGPKDTFKIDTKGMKIYETRVKNGFRLFGKYYSGLWD
jgi:hypothetical protein|tara:strand:+ start:156 stop:782 length:627 start_codon:yes stop_codon:yes gene_type:complete